MNLTRPLATAAALGIATSGAVITTAAPADAATRIISVQTTSNHAIFKGRVDYSKNTVRIRGTLADQHRSRGTAQVQARLQYARTNWKHTNGKTKRLGSTTYRKTINSRMTPAKSGIASYRVLMRVCHGPVCSPWKPVTSYHRVR